MTHVSGGMLMTHFHNFFTVELNADLNFEYTDKNNDIWSYDTFLNHINTTFGGNNETTLLHVSRVKYASMFQDIDEYLSKFRVKLDASGYGWRVLCNGKLISYEAFIKSFQDNFSYIHETIELNSHALFKYADDWFTRQCDLVTEEMFGKNWKLNFKF